MKYKTVNQIYDQLESTGQILPSEQEAIIGVKKIWKKAFRIYEKKTSWHYPIVFTSGNRNTRFNYKFLGKRHPTRKTRLLQYSFIINLKKDWGYIGWKDIIHTLSHYAMFRIKPREKPHSTLHERMEFHLANYVLEKGFHQGVLKKEIKPKIKPEKIRQNIVQLRAKQIDEKIKKWETKLKRAETYLKKLRKKQKYYQKKIR